MKIRFTKSHKVAGIDGRQFVEGDVIGLPDESAQGYIDDGCAVAIDARPKAPAREKKIKAKD